MPTKIELPLPAALLCSASGGKNESRCLPALENVSIEPPVGITSRSVSVIGG